MLASKKTSSAYEYVERELRGAMDAQEACWDRQDERRLGLLQRQKQRQQNRLELQRRSGQMVTTTSMYLSSQPPLVLGELSKVTRRALRTGELVPHGSHCCVSSYRHSSCGVPQAVLDDAEAMSWQQGEKNSEAGDCGGAGGVSGAGSAAGGAVGGNGSMGEKKHNGKATYDRRRREALNHFRQLAAVPNGPENEAQDWDGTVEARPRARAQCKTSLDQVAASDTFRKEIIAALASKRFTPEELETLLEQEKKDRLGAQFLQQGLFTVTEGMQLPEYSGKFDECDKTRFPASEVLELRASLRTQKNAMTSSCPPQPIRTVSLGQMLAIGKLSQRLDSDGLLDVELAPETEAKLRRKQRKAVSFAPEKELHRLGYKDDASDTEEHAGDVDQLDQSIEEESQRGFDSYGPGETLNKTGHAAEALGEIEWFERRHKIE